jgi:hypothetical protein
MVVARMVVGRMLVASVVRSCMVVVVGCMVVGCMVLGCMMVGWGRIASRRYVKFIVIRGELRTEALELTPYLPESSSAAFPGDGLVRFCMHRSKLRTTHLELCEASPGALLSALRKAGRDAWDYSVCFFCKADAFCQLARQLFNASFSCTEACVMSTVSRLDFGMPFLQAVVMRAKS